MMEHAWPVVDVDSKDAGFFFLCVFFFDMEKNHQQSAFPKSCSNKGCVCLCLLLKLVHPRKLTWRAPK